MPDITPIVRPSRAAQVLTEAVNAARNLGLIVWTKPDLGVVATSTHQPGWERDPHATAVSVLGAVLLARQPPIVDVDHALAHVFRTRPEFCEGLEEGVKGSGPPASDADQLFAEGWFIGVQMRSLVSTIRCVTHLVQYPYGDRCPKCAAGVPVERPQETTDRMQIDTPRSVIAELIASLTIAQVLEALADSVPGRGMPIDDAAEWVKVLHELADDARKDGQ